MRNRRSVMNKQLLTVAAAAKIYKAVSHLSDSYHNTFLLDMLVVFLINQKDYEHPITRDYIGEILVPYLGSIKAYLCILHKLTVFESNDMISPSITAT